MKIFKTTIQGCAIDVIFTGTQHIFNSDFFGLVCVANRIYDGIFTPDNERFELIVGNSICLGSRLSDMVVLSGVKKFIRKKEGKYIKVECAFTETNKDLENWVIDIKAYEYKFN